MSFDLAERFVRGDIPELQRAIVVAGCKRPTVGVEGDGGHPRSLFDAIEQLAGRGIPEYEVVTAAGEQVGFGAEAPEGFGFAQIRTREQLALG